MDPDFVSSPLIPIAKQLNLFHPGGLDGAKAHISGTFEPYLDI